MLMAMTTNSSIRVNAVWAGDANEVKPSAFSKRLFKNTFIERGILKGELLSVKTDLPDLPNTATLIQHSLATMAMLREMEAGRFRLLHPHVCGMH
jgi:hypothetical protein